MDSTPNRFEYAAKIILYGIAFLLPLWFIPGFGAVELGREITFTALVVVAAILWLLSILTRGEVRYQRSLLAWASLGFIGIVLIATLFSDTRLISALLADPTAEKFSTLFTALLLMLLVGGILRTPAEARRVASLLLYAGILSGLLKLLQFTVGVAPLKYLLAAAETVHFNPVGTTNGLSLLYAVLFLMSFEMLLSPPAARRGVRIVPAVACLIFFTNLVLINFRSSWLILLVGGVFLFGLMFKNLRPSPATSHVEEEEMVPSEADGRRRNLGWRYWLSLFLLVVSVGMFAIRSLPVAVANLPAEVSPTLSTTLSIAKSTLAAGPKQFLFGSGPATFGLDWTRYRDPAVNQTVFWNIRFNQGQSWVSTVIPTLGILGTLAFLAFLLLPLVLFLRQLFTDAHKETTLAVSIFLGLIGLVAAAFLYPANSTLVWMTFLFVGLLSFLFRTTPSEPADIEVVSLDSAPPSAAVASKRWGILDQAVRFERQWSIFLSSLLIIFLIALGVAGLYLQFSRLRGAVAQERATEALANGRVDRAVDYLERAVLFEDYHYRNYLSLLQVRMEKLRNLIQRASRGENVQQEFQTQVALAIQNADRATRLYDKEPLVWRTQGTFFELMIPFVQGSENSAYASYQRAAELDRLNPAVHVDWARATFTFSERIDFLHSNARGAEREQLEQIRQRALSDAVEQIQESLARKPDFAPAHFLLAQIGLRTGDTEAAIQSAERAKLSAPFDIGIALQLGLLYYQNEDLQRAEQELSRAISLDDNYSNARYFLGLIYDRRGETARAIEQFERIQRLNPGNDEVARILANLRAGQGALEGIVPPGTPPEERREPPVR